jgi:hypothetical protein
MDRKFKIGDRVKVVNTGVHLNGWDHLKGEIGEVTFAHDDADYYGVSFDNYGNFIVDESEIDFADNKPEETLIKGKYPIHHISLPNELCYEKIADFESTSFNIFHHVAIKIAESFDDAVLDKIKEIATEEGYDDLVLIDREFVVSALKHEIERRNQDD